MTSTETANPSLAADTSSDPSVDTASPSVNADTQASASPGETPATAPVAPIDDRAELLSIVQNVVQADPKNPKGEGQPTASELEAPKDNTAATPDPLDADPTDDELKALQPRTKRRMEQVLKQRNEARTEAETLKPAAARWQQMDGYLKRHDLAAEDVNLLLGVGAALRRGDFKAFLDGVSPYVDLARQNLGLTLPADLQSKVDEGEISTEAATELSVTRLTNARLADQAKANTVAAQTAAQAEQQTRLATSVNAAVTSWEAEVKSRDPDYAKKAATVLRFSQALMAEHGSPRTPEAAVALAKRAYDEANDVFKGALPPPVATRPAPVGARAVNNARAEPRTLMEAARLGLERSRA